MEILICSFESQAIDFILDPQRSQRGNCTVAHSSGISEQFQSSDSPYFGDPDFIFYVINLLILF